MAGLSLRVLRWSPSGGSPCQAFTLCANELPLRHRLDPLSPPLWPVSAGRRCGRWRRLPTSSARLLQMGWTDRLPASLAIGGHPLQSKSYSVVLARSTCPIPLTKRVFNSLFRVFVPTIVPAAISRCVSVLYRSLILQNGKKRIIDSN